MVLTSRESFLSLGWGKSYLKPSASWTGLFRVHNMASSYRDTLFFNANLMSLSLLSLIVITIATYDCTALIWQVSCQIYDVTVLPFHWWCNHLACHPSTWPQSFDIQAPTVAVGLFLHPQVAQKGVSLGQNHLTELGWWVKLLRAMEKYQLVGWKSLICLNTVWIWKSTV